MSWYLGWCNDVAVQFFPGSKTSKKTFPTTHRAPHTPTTNAINNKGAAKKVQRRAEHRENNQKQEENQGRKKKRWQ
jgi:hypothetical protein